MDPEKFETPVEIVTSMLARRERSKARLIEAITIPTNGRHLAHQAGSLLAAEEAVDILKEVLAEITPVDAEIKRLSDLVTYYENKYGEAHDVAPGRD
jgi:5,10-methylenetetrahydrofolate reductase